MNSSHAFSHNLTIAGYDDAGLHRRERPDISDYFWQAFEPVTNQKEHVLGSLLRISVSTDI